MAHARLSPSAAHRWLVCPASVRESENAVSSDTEYSKLGTAGHAVMKMWFDTGSAPEPGTTLPDGTVVTEQMVNLARPAVMWVREQLALAERHVLLTEEKVVIGPAFGVDGDTLYGTADILAICDDELIVADLKTGYNEVLAEENPQLLLYAIGAAEEMGWMWKTIRMVIIQPQAGGVKEWVLSKDDLLARIERLKPAVLAALDPLAPYHPTEEGCRYCPAAGVCKALQEHSLALARREFDTVEALVSHISAADLSEILTKAGLIEAALKAAREHALKLIQTGVEVPGWKVVEGRKNRRWKEGSEPEVVKTLTVLGYDPDQFAPRKLVSPAQAEGLLKDKSVVAQYAEKPQGEPVLAPAADKRPPLPPTFTSIDTGNLLE